MALGVQTQSHLNQSTCCACPLKWQPVYKPDRHAPLCMHVHLCFNANAKHNVVCARRSIRVLRVSMKVPGVQVVADALRNLIPALGNTLAVGGLFFYIFAVSVCECVCV